MLLVPLLVAIALAYAFRDQLFGTDQPVRLATAGALILIGWAFARSLSKALEPQLVNHLDPGSAGVVGFLVRFLALLAIGRRCRSRVKAAFGRGELAWPARPIKSPRRGTALVPDASSYLSRSSTALDT